MPHRRLKPEEAQWPPPVPPNESESERETRLAEEKEAKNISDAIDQRLSVEREKRKRPPTAKILLLGE